MNQTIRNRINQIKNGQVPEGYEKTFFGVFPVDWEKNKKLKSICEFCGGGTPSTKKIDLWNGDIPWISSSDLIDNNVNKIKMSRFINKKSIQNSATKLCPKGSLLIVSRVGVGKLAVASTDICTSQDFTNIIKANCNIYFLAYSLMKRISIEINKTQGTSIKGLSSEEIKKIKIAYPKSQTEQAKIAEILMKWDEAIAAQEQLIQKLEIRKKALMQKLLTPKEGWTYKFLGDISYISTGKLDANAMVNKGKYRFYTCAKEYYNIDNYAFKGDCLIISGNGANVGYIHHYNGEFNAYQRTYVLQNLKNNILYVKSYLDMHLSKRIKNEVKEGNTPYIVFNTLSKMKIYFPPNEFEQDNIANILSLAYKEIELHKQHLDQLIKQRRSMMQLLLTGIVRVNEKLANV